MLMLQQTIKNLNRGQVLFYNYDEEYDVLTFILNDVHYEVQIYNNTLYMVTTTDDLSGEELEVGYYTIKDFKELLS